MHYLKQIIKTIDLFGQPIELSFNQNPLQKSLFGGINTLILMIIFISITFQGFLEILLRTNITSFTTDIYPSQPPYLDINPHVLNWAISFQPSSLNTWGDIGRFFKVEVFQGIYT